jgi:hypothetical protein
VKRGATLEGGECVAEEKRRRLPSMMSRSKRMGNYDNVAVFSRAFKCTTSTCKLGLSI